MPYKVQKKGSQYCVHKENTDGSIGEEVACHDSKSLADEQVKALYANESTDNNKAVDMELDGSEDMEEPMDSVTSFSIPSGKGLYAWADYIRASWDHEVEEGDLRYSWINEIFPDYVIVSRGYGPKSKNFKVPYMVSGDEVEFDVDNKEKVELKVEWVNKAFNQNNPLAIKAIGEDRIGGYAILWGSETQKDLDGQYFTEETEDLLTVFKAMGKIPWLVQHAADEVIKSVPVAEVTKLEPDSSGLWFEAKVIAHDLYKNYVSRLIAAGKLFSSVGALPASVKAEKSGHISRFAVAELSGTWSPADPHQVIAGYSVDKLKAHFEEIGIDSTDLFDEKKPEPETVAKQRDTEEVADKENDTERAELGLAQDWLNLQKLQVEF